MSLYQNLFLILGCISLPLLSYGQFVEAQIDSAAQLRQTSFIDQFPFQDYVEYLSETSVASLVKDIEFLQEHEGPVDLFLDSIHALQLRHIQLNPDDYDFMLGHLRTGEMLLQLDGIKKGFVFPAFGDLMLQSLSTHIDKGFAEKSYKPANREIQYIIKRLRENKFFVNVPVSDWQKGFDHLKSGNFSYLFRKVRLKQPFLFYGAILTMVLIPGAGVFFIRRKNKKYLLNKKQPHQSPKTDSIPEL